MAQTVHVDVSAGKVIAFDPDKAMGTSRDILSANEFDTGYSEAIVQAGLSAAWGPLARADRTSSALVAIVKAAASCRPPR